MDQQGWRVMVEREAGEVPPWRRPEELSDAELIERLRRRPLDRWAMEAARRLEERAEGRGEPGQGRRG